jgi:4'-phosphopantetheinyl transferase
MIADLLQTRTPARWQAPELMRLDWCPPVGNVPLFPGQIHIWYVRLDGEGEECGGFSFLSGDEKARSKRLLSPLNRKRFTRARAALRAILSLYCEVPPDLLRFGYSQKGKPYLMQAGLPFPLEFNISHCGDHMLTAVSSAGSVGVDLERVQPMDTGEQIIRQFFSDHDQKAYQSLPSDKRDISFFTAWTRREAFGKALGSGLAMDAPQDFMFLKDGLFVPPGQFEMARFSGCWILRFQVEGEYIAAAAVLANQRPGFSFFRSSNAWLSSRLIGEEVDSPQRESSGLLRV